MNSRVIHTPDGVRDLYGESIERKRKVMEGIRSVFGKYGCRPIETPTFEYFDVFGSSIGTTPSNELYKFFDRDGNTLVLRPDFTPSVARAVCMHFPDEALPVRLCYEGSTFVNAAEMEGRLKESTQMGTEFIGMPDPDDDAEIISLACDALLAAGIESFQISIGQTAFYRALAKDSGLDEETLEAVRHRIAVKNVFGVREILADRDVDPDIRGAMIRLPQLFGGEEVLVEAERQAYGEDSRKAVAALVETHERIKKNGFAKFISYDLGALSRFRYYTGIIFSAFIYGAGEPVAKGGRYDKLLANFGRDLPAVGVGFSIDPLTAALVRGEGRGI